MMTKEQKLDLALTLAKKYVGGDVVKEIEGLAATLKVDAAGMFDDDGDESDIVILAIVVWVLRSVATAAKRRW
jgi:hypothetical protein